MAVGDWVLPSDDGERVEHVLPRRSVFVRRPPSRVPAGTAAAGREHRRGLPRPCPDDTAEPATTRTGLVLAYDSSAAPVIVLSKSDLVDDPHASVVAAEPIALSARPAASGRTGAGLDRLAELAGGHRTIALLGASGVGKSTLVNGLVGRDVDTGAVREQDDRGRHTTTAAELVGLPGGGWLIDTPGLRAVSLWASGQGIERAFQDVFDLAERCRFRDCKHEGEPGCAVLDAVAAGTLDPLAESRNVSWPGSGTRGGATGQRAGHRPQRRPQGGPQARRTGLGRPGSGAVWVWRSTFRPWTSPSPIDAWSTAPRSRASWTSASTRTSVVTRKRSRTAATRTTSRP